MNLKPIRIPRKLRGVLKQSVRIRRPVRLPYVGPV